MRYLSVDLDPTAVKHTSCDVVVVGSGIAGLTAALELSKDHDVVLVTKGDLRQTTTWLAQGGLAATVSKKDSPLYHLKDTVIAGDDLCDLRAVETLVHDGPRYVNDLIKLGTRFDVSGQRFSLGREGGHSRRRILHFKDATGSEIQDSLVRASETYASIDVREHTFAVDILRSEGRTIGLLTLDLSKGVLRTILTSRIIIASGGACQIYSATTNPDVATGDGIAMAYRAGAEVMDMEFVQFHPTVFFKDGKAAFLITEALRGEGAYLINERSERIMEKVHPLKELAPRDIVSRTIFKEMRRAGGQVFIDARHIPRITLAKRFPAISRFLSENGFDIARDLVPIAPAAHYFIGGVRTDINGRTNLPGVYACGETAATGVHGANRLASNSLLEGLVFARRIADQVREDLERENKKRTRTQNTEAYLGFSSQHSTRPAILDARALEEHRRLIGETMWANVSVFRNKAGLTTALSTLHKLGKVKRIKVPRKDLLEVKNLLTIAELVTRSALLRTESRGVHYRADHPRKKDRKWLAHIIVTKGRYRVIKADRTEVIKGPVHE